jgi:hypothetical protein
VTAIPEQRTDLPCAV